MTPHIWQHPPPDLALAVNEIHVWRVWLEQPPHVVDHLAQMLSPDEEARAERFHFAQHREGFIVSRGGLRMVLGHYLNMLPQHISFAYSSSGKPLLAKNTGEYPLSFNISHSHHLALYAVAWNRILGIDVEHLHSVEYQERIVQRYFAPREQATFQALKEEDRQQGFFNCWTRKEAWLKAQGTGIGGSLASIDVSLTPGKPAKLYYAQGEDVRRWRIEALEPADGYVGALVAEGQQWHVCWVQWYPTFFNKNLRA